MSEHRAAGHPDRLDDPSPDERCSDVAERERQACLKIVEDHLRLLVEERRLDPILIVESIAERIRRRSESRAPNAPPS